MNRIPSPRSTVSRQLILCPSVPSELPLEMARPFARRCAEASEQVLTGLQFNGPRTPEAPSVHTLPPAPTHPSLDHQLTTALSQHVCMHCKRRITHSHRTDDDPRTCGWEQSRVGSESTEHRWVGSSTFAVEANIFDAVEGGAVTNGAHVVLMEDRPGLSIRPVSVIQQSEQG